MSNRNKRKGKYFEEKVAEMIRNIWKLNKHECHRAQSSGTYQTDYSDIVLNPEKYRRPHVVIECKKRKSINPFALFNITSYKEFNNWLEQIEKSAQKYKNEFNIEPLKLIILGIDYYPIITILHEDWLLELDRRNIFLTKHPSQLKNYIYCKGFFITTLHDLFSECIQLIPQV